jgi:hypothetical protein
MTVLWGAGALLGLLGGGMLASRLHGALGELVIHGIALVRSGQLRFRLETFGLWYPRPLYQAPWWQPDPRVLWHLAGRIGGYAAWLRELNAVGRAGSTGWWATVLPPAAFVEWRTALERADRTGDVKLYSADPEPRAWYVAYVRAKARDQTQAV